MSGMDVLSEVFGKKPTPKVTFGRLPAQELKKQKEQKAEKAAAVKKDETKKKKRISEFDDQSDFVLTMMMVALMHIDPELSPEEAIKSGKEWARKLGTPNKDYLWRKQAIQIKKQGIRAAASRIRRELFKLI